MIEYDGIFDMDDVRHIDTIWQQGYFIPSFTLNGDISEIMIRPSGCNIMIVPFVTVDNFPYYINVNLRYNNGKISSTTWDLFRQLKPMQSVSLECSRGIDFSICNVDLIRILSVKDETINSVQYCDNCGSFIFVNGEDKEYQCCASISNQRHISHTPMKYYEQYKK